MNREVNEQVSDNVTTRSAGMFSSLKQDTLASVVVFLVALPLCMGIAIASGVPVAAGLITGIVGGLVVGWIAGAPLQVSGPAAGVTVIVFDLVQRHGLEVLGIAVLIAGALQLIAGVLSYGRWFRAVSPAVIHGMLAGIGVLIISSQFHVMVDDTPKSNGIENLLSIPKAILKGLPMPELSLVEERISQRNFLHQCVVLHEQQIQIHELVTERISVPLADANHNHLSRHLESSLSNKLRFEPLVAKQQEMSDRFTSLIEQLDKWDIAETVRDPAGLKEVTKQSLEQMRIALDALRQGDVERVRASQADIQHSLGMMLGELKNHHDWAAKVGLLTILALLLWKAFVPKRLKLIPAPLVAVVIVTIASAILKLPVLYVEVPDNLWNEIHFPSLAAFTSVSPGVVFQAGIVLAVVASAETLLCATAVDQMQSHSRTQYDRELAAQGIGNMVCGLLGALPMTGVIVRSAANVEAGAKTRISTILHGLWLLVFVALLASILRMIPTAALAAMLVYTGYKLVDFKAIRELKKYGWGEVAIYFVTLGTIVCTDLLTGVLTGIGLSALKLLYTFSHLNVRLAVDQKRQVAVLRLEGAATFIRLPLLATKLELVPQNVELHVDFEHLNHVDHACLDLLMNWAKQHEGTGGVLVIDWESLHANFHSGPQHNQRVRRQRAA
jgi:MFS superfamily sulfate permease-like transporter